MTGVAQMPALISATGVSPEPRMKLPRGARLDQRARPDLFVQVPLATPSGSRLALIRLDHGHPTKQRARAARTLLYRARPVLADGQGGSRLTRTRAAKSDPCAP